MNKGKIQRTMGFPGGSLAKNMPADAGDMGPITRSGRSPGEGNGKPHLYSCLENSTRQCSLVGYSLWDLKRVGHNFVT